MRHNTIDFEALRYVLIAAGVGTFGEAAKTVGIGSASLGRRIARVEDELGVTLFERSRSGIRLTKAGREAIVHVRRALGSLDAIMSTGQGDAAGEIGLGIRLPLIGDPIQTLLRAWRTRHPQIRLKVHELNERDIISAIEERRLDLAFMAKHTLWAGAASIPIYRERLLLALPKTHPLTLRKTLGWSALANQTFLVQGWEESQASRDYYKSLLGHSVRFHSHAVSKQSILGLVSAGFGVTLVTRSQAHVRIPGIVFRRILEDDAVLEVHLVWASENEDALVGRFVAFMRELSASKLLL
jgi:DNA-binding transcriptional LysR family regulator